MSEISIGEYEMDAIQDSITNEANINILKEIGLKIRKIKDKLSKD